MKLTYSNACSGSSGRVRYQGAKKRLAKGKYLNALFANAVKAVINTNKRKNSKALSDSSSED